MIHKCFSAILLFFLISCNNPGSSDVSSIQDSMVSNDPELMKYTVLASFPHDTTSYTEGFLVHDGTLYESTGHTPDIASTRSLFGTVDLKTGKINAKVEIDKEKYFGEGIVFLNGNVYQLTWRTKIGFIYDAKTFKRTGQFIFPSAEGWGMTTDGRYLVMSDGTSNITFLDPTTFKTINIITVTDNNGPVSNVNELEYIKGFIYANVYGTEYVLKIDPFSGKVIGRADFSNLLKEAKAKYSGVDVMNGIAYDSVKNKIYVTGKLWPNIYEIKFN